MKTLITTLLVVFSLSLFAQEVVGTSYIERTKVGAKIGASVGYTFQYGITVGAFRQEATSAFAKPERIPRLYEKNFTGVYFMVPVREYKMIEVDLSARVGAVNGEYFLITPSVWTYFKPLRVFQVGAGVGVRAFRPTLQGSITFNL